MYIRLLFLPKNTFLFSNQYLSTSRLTVLRPFQSHNQSIPLVLQPCNNLNPIINQASLSAIMQYSFSTVAVAALACIATLPGLSYAAPTRFSVAESNFTSPSVLSNFSSYALTNITVAESNLTSPSVLSNLSFYALTNITVGDVTVEFSKEMAIEPTGLNDNSLAAQVSKSKWPFPAPDRDWIDKESEWIRKEAKELKKKEKERKKKEKKEKERARKQLEKEKEVRDISLSLSGTSLCFEGKADASPNNSANMCFFFVRSKTTCSRASTNTSLLFYLTKIC